MKFQYVDIAAIRDFIPPWALNYMIFARELDECLRKYVDNISQGHIPQPFMIEVHIDGGALEFRLFESRDQNEPEQEMGMLMLVSDRWEIGIPLSYMLKGIVRSEGTYSLYSHGIATEIPLAYIGITSRPWFVRYAEHHAAARNGSGFLFHDALRLHDGKFLTHRILIANIDKDTAMRREEEWVAPNTLYPLGLNMIPGGYAGLRYLSTLSIELRDSEYSAESIADAMNRDLIGGKPNPLCAARWAADPNYVARVICGHSGRLTLEQVHMIRAMGVACRAVNEIAILAKANNIAQVKRLLSNRTYSRVQ